MLVIISVFGVLIAVMSLWGLVQPQAVVRLVRSVATSRFGLAFAVSVRVLLGFALIFAASSTPFPQIIFALGVIALLAALGLLIMGMERVNQLVDWFAKASATTLRAAFVFGAAFGGFLLYASV